MLSVALMCLQRPPLAEDCSRKNNADSLSQSIVFEHFSVSNSRGTFFLLLGCKNVANANKHSIPSHN